MGEVHGGILCGEWISKVEQCTKLRDHRGPHSEPVLPQPDPPSADTPEDGA